MTLMGRDWIDVVVEVVVPLSVVEDVVEFDTVVVVVDVVSEVVVVVPCVDVGGEPVVVVDGDVELDAAVITNPHPRDGSLRLSGSETGTWNVVDGVGEVVVVVPCVDVGDDPVVVVDVVVVVAVVVVVVVDAVVEGEADVLFESSSPAPETRSASSTMERIARKRHRVCGGGLGEFRICSSP